MDSHPGQVEAALSKSTNVLVYGGAVHVVWREVSANKSPRDSFQRRVGEDFEGFDCGVVEKLRGVGEAVG